MLMSSIQMPFKLLTVEMRAMAAKQSPTKNLK
jgi:hypothetical protein